MPPNNLGYASRAADLILQKGQALSMKDFNRASAMTQAVQQIPGNFRGMLQQRDQRSDRAEQSQVRGAQMEAYQANTRRTNAETDRGEREDDESEAIQDVFRVTPQLPTGGQDWDTIIPAIAKISPEKAEAARALQREEETRSQNILKEKNEFVLGAIFGVKDQAGWDGAKKRLGEKNPELAKGLPQVFDPEYQDLLLRELIGTRAWIESKQKPPPELELVTFTNPDGSETQEYIERRLGNSRTGAAPAEPAPGQFDMERELYNAKISGDTAQYRSLLEVLRDFKGSDATAKNAQGRTQEEVTEAVKWRFNERKDLMAVFAAAAGTAEDRAGLNAAQTRIFIDLPGGRGRTGPFTSAEKAAAYEEVDVTYNYLLGMGPEPAQTPRDPRAVVGGVDQSKVVVPPGSTREKLLWRRTSGVGSEPRRGQPPGAVAPPPVPASPAAAPGRTSGPPAGAPPSAGASPLPSSIAVGDIYVVNGQRHRVESMGDGQVSAIGETGDPKVGDLLFDGGEWVKITSISGDDVRVMPVGQ